MAQGTTHDASRKAVDMVEAPLQDPERRHEPKQLLNIDAQAKMMASQPDNKELLNPS
jgi:hypothetical protein